MMNLKKPCSKCILAKAQVLMGSILRFTKNFYHLIGQEITNTCSNWLATGCFPFELNETNVCLIPKAENPTSLKELRLVALCNVLYKIMSKAIANQLKHVLANLVSEEQAAFVSGLYIIDNVLVAFDHCII